MRGAGDRVPAAAWSRVERLEHEYHNAARAVVPRLEQAQVLAKDIDALAA